MPAFDVLRAYLSARAAFTTGDLQVVEAAFTERTLAPGMFLQRAGEPARWGAFVARGCLRSYVVDSQGNEHIVQFAPEQWWLSDVESLASGQPSRYFIDAVEDSDLLLIDPPAHERLLVDVPAYAASFQRGLQRHAAAKDRRIVGALTDTAAARYREFVETYPSLAARVPQWMLASYLGITPETLSRVRARRRPRS